MNTITKIMKLKLFYLVLCFSVYASLFTYYKPHPTGITFVVNGVDINLVPGNITRQHDVDAIVNPVNQHVKKGGGVCGAIFSAAFEAACISARNSFKESKAPVGSVLLTDGGNSEPYILHVVVPNFNPTNFVQKSLLFDEIGKNLLEKVYFNLLSLTIEKGFERIAIPFLSGDNFSRIPSDRDELAAIALESVLHFCKSKVKYGTLKEVRFVLYDAQDFEIFAKELDDIVR